MIEARFAAMHDDYAIYCWMDTVVGLLCSKQKRQKTYRLSNTHPNLANKLSS